jgi:hypothetical protein
LSFRIGAQHIVGKFIVFEIDFALLVVDHLHEGVPENIGIIVGGSE